MFLKSFSICQQTVLFKNPPPKEKQSHEAVLATVKDCHDSINREANFIMFRVEECDSEEAIERKEYDTFVNDFLHCIDSREV